MQQRKLLGRALAVVVVLVLVGGVGVALYGGVTGRSGNSDVTATTTTGLGDEGYGVQGAIPTGASVPSTVILGVGESTSTATVTAVITSSSITTTGGAGADQLTTTPASGNGSGSSTSGHSIEFLGNIALQVKDPSGSLQQVSAIAGALGGYVAATTYDSSTNGTAAMTVMVPAQDFQTALSRLEGIGMVVSIQSSSDDVSVQYADLNATLASLQTEQHSLLKLLNSSNSINSTIQIESILQQTDAQINTVESQILQTAQLVDYATISVTLETPTTPVANAPLAIKVSATPRSGMSPLSVTFDAVVTGGTGPYLVNYNFGDGTSSEGQQLIHQFVNAGTFNVTVSATDQKGNVSLAYVVVRVNSPPAASAFSTFGASVWSLFAGVVEGIVEVAAVVVPIFLVGYAVVIPTYRRISRGRGSGQTSSAGTPK